jgi:predicted nucleic acid-binding protein
VNDRPALDTSVIVAALAPWHERHAAALAALQAALAGRQPAVLPMPALLESWSVLTGMPRPHRVGAAAARDALRQTFAGKVRLAGMPAREAWQILDSVTTRGLSGGIAHDAHIVACARAASATSLLSFNRRHFELLDLGGLRIVEPA